MARRRAIVGLPPCHSRFRVTCLASLCHHLHLLRSGQSSRQVLYGAHHVECVQYHCEFRHGSTQLLPQLSHFRGVRGRLRRGAGPLVQAHASGQGVESVHLSRFLIHSCAVPRELWKVYCPHPPAGVNEFLLEIMIGVSLRALKEHPYIPGQFVRSCVCPLLNLISPAAVRKKTVPARRGHHHALAAVRSPTGAPGLPASACASGTPARAERSLRRSCRYRGRDAPRSPTGRRCSTAPATGTRCRSPCRGGDVRRSVTGTTQAADRVRSLAHPPNQAVLGGSGKTACWGFRTLPMPARMSATPVPC